MGSCLTKNEQKRSINKKESEKYETRTECNGINICMEN